MSESNKDKSKGSDNSSSKQDGSNTPLHLGSYGGGIFGLMAKNESTPKKKKPSDSSFIDKMFDILNSKK